MRAQVEHTQATANQAQSADGALDKIVGAIQTISDTAIRIADISAMHGIECMIGCMLEGGISVAAAVHVAVAKADVITKVDLDGPSLCQGNPVEGGVIFNESEISITDAPGLGIRKIHGLETIA